MENKINELTNDKLKIEKKNLDKIFSETIKEQLIIFTETVKEQLKIFLNKSTSAHREFAGIRSELFRFDILWSKK